MKSCVSKLQLLLGPVAPEKVCDWHAIEKSLKVSLPEDFKEFWSNFGPGMLGFRNTDPEFLVLHSPYFEAGYARFPDCVTIMAENYRGLKAEFPEYLPHTVWPEPAGLLGF